MRTLLRLRGVEARYGRFVALQNVSLVVPERSVVALLGPNGMGKTTLLRTVSGMLKPSRGEIWFDGRRIDGLADHQIARLGIAHIPEGRGIFPGLSVEENLSMAAYGMNVPESALGRVYDYFPRLADRRAQTAGTLSGGEQQMLAMARALIVEPKLLMVDELSFGLAPRLVSALFESLERIRESGTAILLVEQYVRHALAIADIVVTLHKGHVQFIGDAGEFAGEGALAGAYLGAGGAAAAPTPAAPAAPAVRARRSRPAMRRSPRR